MKVSVLGLGQMGSAIASRLIDAGHTVRVWNRSPGKATALVAEGAIELGAVPDSWASDVCITMLADSRALTDVTLGPNGLLSESTPRGKTLIDMSTVSAESSRRIAEVAESLDLKYLRAPVSGNPGVVRAGNLTVVVSGEKSDCAAMDGLLRDVGPNVHRAGDGESARVVKLALNLMIAGTAELLAESVALAQAHNIDRPTLLGIMSESVIGSPFVRYKVGPLLDDDYTSTFSTRLMRKDVELVLASAAAGGVALPVTGVVHQLLQECISTGLGELDFMSLLIRLERQSGQSTSATPVNQSSLRG